MIKINVSYCRNEFYLKPIRTTWQETEGYIGNKEGEEGTEEEKNSIPSIFDHSMALYVHAWQPSCYWLAILS